MAFVSQMIDQLRDLLNDATDTQVPYATKKLYLNLGIARLWPHVWYLDEFSVDLSSSEVDYNLDADVSRGRIVSVEYVPATPSGGEGAYRLSDYDLIPGDEAELGYIRIPFKPGNSADFIRLKVALPIPFISAANYAASQAETWLGPTRALGLPVLYAMGMIAARKLDDRQDTNRYSTTRAINGVTDSGIIQASQVWFSQFEIELEAMTELLPPARD